LCGHPCRRWHGSGSRGGSADPQPLGEADPPSVTLAQQRRRGTQAWRRSSILEVWTPLWSGLITSDAPKHYRHPHSPDHHQPDKPALCRGPAPDPEQRWSSDPPTLPSLEAPSPDGRDDVDGPREDPAADAPRYAWRGVRPIHSKPVDGPPSSAHDERNRGGWTIPPGPTGPGTHSRAFEKTSLRLRRHSLLLLNGPAADQASGDLRAGRALSQVYWRPGPAEKRLADSSRI
jgi:hypothetical protein